MAYKQNFGPSRKSGKAMSMCGVSRIVSPLNKESFSCKDCRSKWSLVK